MNNQTAQLLEQHFDTAFSAPDGIKKLRELILTLAMQGRLVPQDPNDPPASQLLKEIEAEKKRLVKEGVIKKPKALPEIKAEEVPYEVPGSWEWVTLGSCSHIERGGSPRPIAAYLTDDDDGLNWIKIGDTEKDSKFITSTNQKIIREGLAKTRMVYPGDFLLTNSMSFGRPYITKIEGCIHDGWLRIHPPSALNKDYLYNVLTSPYVAKTFSNMASGAVVQNLNADKVRSLLFPLPPLPEQHRIVAKIDQLMARCDELEKLRDEHEQKRRNVHTAALNQLLEAQTDDAFTDAWHFITQHFTALYSVKENVDALRKAILQLAVMGKLVPQDPSDPPASALLKEIEAEKKRLVKEGVIKKPKPLPPIKPEEVPYEVPGSWEWVRLGDISISSDSGWSPQCLSRPRIKTEWGVLKVSAVSWGNFDSTQNKALPQNMQPKPECEVKKDDFLISRANTSDLVARSVVVNETPPSLMMSDKIVRYTFSKHINKLFINVVNGTVSSRAYYIANASGTSSSMKNVSRQVMSNLPIPLPPLVEQHRIVAKIARLMARCDALEERIDATTVKKSRLLSALVAQV